MARRRRAGREVRLGRRRGIVQRGEGPGQVGPLAGAHLPQLIQTYHAKYLLVG